MSLFQKTLLWFLGTAAATILAVAVVAILNYDEADQRRPAFAIMMELHEARRVYETGGAPALRESLRRLQERTGVHASVADRNGRDLVTGEDLSQFTRAPRDWPGVVARFDREHAAWYILRFPRRSWVRWWFRPEHIGAMIAVILLLCWAFARHVTRPVQRLQRIVECFGRGEFGERARWDRGDELGQLARTFNQMADRIETLLVAERRLLADISHELRSPLARLSLAAELARSDENRDEHLDRIQKETERLNSLVGELLQVTRAEGDPSQLHAEPVRLDEVARAVVEDSRIESSARGSEIRLRAQPVEVRGDGELLRRALENVIRNAIRYEPKGSAIEVTVDARGVAVRDHGPGVPEEAVDRIFDAFYRVEADRARKSGGVGLGLSIAKRAIELHRGRIVAENARPGLLVRIELPTSGPAAEFSDSPEAERPHPAHSG
ncbi:MAG TPA: ATP-binding protein [Bryobacteraceae bacterium]|nr:ATP-binding protein [Bryobacteraceae bacterium]